MTFNDGSMDLPYEPQDETPLTDAFVVCGGVVAMAAKLDDREEGGAWVHALLYVDIKEDQDG